MKRLFIVIGIILALWTFTNIQTLAKGEGINGYMGKIAEKPDIIDNPNKYGPKEMPVSLESVDPQEIDIDVSMPPNGFRKADNLDGAGGTKFSYLGGL